MKRLTRFVCLSDTHNQHDAIAVPDGDVLLHAGDLTGRGEPREIFDAFAWLAKQPHERVIVTPGNHDFGLEGSPVLISALRNHFPKVELLIDAETMIGNARIWCAPWQPWFNDWAFNLPRNGDAIAAKWDLIPDDTAVLVTHGPPFGVLDTTLRGEHVGCEALLARVAELSHLRLHVFGHIHEAYGQVQRGEVAFVNACTCDAKYKPVQPPIVFELNL